MNSLEDCKKGAAVTAVKSLSKNPLVAPLIWDVFGSFDLAIRQAELFAANLSPKIKAGANIHQVYSFLIKSIKRALMREISRYNNYDLVTDSKTGLLKTKIKHYTQVGETDGNEENDEDPSSYIEDNSLSTEPDPADAAEKAELLKVLFNTIENELSEQDRKIIKEALQYNFNNPLLAKRNNLSYLGYTRRLKVAIENLKRTLKRKDFNSWT